MAFREVSVVQVKEALRRWLNGDGERPIARGVGIDRKTARRYIAAAVELGVDRDGGEGQLTDELIGQVVERVRPHRPDGHGEAWRALLAEEERIKAWVERRPHGGEDRHPAGPARGGGAAPDVGPVRGGALRGGPAIDDGAGGRPAAGRRVAGRLRPAWACRRRRAQAGVLGADLHRVFQPPSVRVADVHPDDRGRDRRASRRPGCYFGGVFPVVIPDNMGSIVVKAENTAPRFNDVFFEYAQSRGFSIDAARVATPTDKPRVERVVPYVRNNFFAGETFVDLADCRARAAAVVHRDRRHAHPRHHPVPADRGVPGRGTAPLLCLPGAPFDVPTWSEPKVHRDFHVEVDKALYSAPHHLIGRRVKARRDSTTVKLYFRGELVKVHPRKAPGQRSHRPGRLPDGQGDLRHP